MPRCWGWICRFVLGAIWWGIGVWIKVLLQRIFFPQHRRRRVFRSLNKKFNSESFIWAHLSARRDLFHRLCLTFCLTIREWQGYQDTTIVGIVGGLCCYDSFVGGKRCRSLAECGLLATFQCCWLRAGGGWMALASVPFSFTWGLGVGSFLKDSWTARGGEAQCWYSCQVQTCCWAAKGWCFCVFLLVQMILWLGY